MSGEIGIKLTGDNSEFRGMLESSDREASKFSAQIADKVADKFMGMRDISTAVATALGLNLQNIAENVARVFTGMTKQEEEAFKKLEQLTEQASEAAIKNMRAMASEETKYNLLLQERDKLQKVIEAGAGPSGVAQVKLAENRIKLEKVLEEIRATELKQQEIAKKKDEERAKAYEQFAKTRADQAEKDFQTQLSTLETGEKIEALKQRIAIAEALIAKGAFEGQQLDQQRLVVAGMRNQLTKEEAELIKDNAKAEEKRIKDHIEAMDSEDKKRESMAANAKELATILLKDGKDLTDQDRVRLEVLKGQKTEAQQQQEVIELSEKLLDGSILPHEEQRLRLLTSQTRERKEGEQAEVRIMNIHRIGLGYVQQSTDALEGVVARLKSQLDSVRNQNAISPVSQRNPFEASILNEYTNAKNELDLRKAVMKYVNVFGEGEARGKFGDTVTDRALRDTLTAAQQTAQAVNTISNQLANAGIRPSPQPAATPEAWGWKWDPNGGVNGAHVWAKL